MTEQQMLYAQIASNIVALAMILVAAWRPEAGRITFSLLFLWASQVNLRTALGTPEVYLEYAPLAYSDLYRSVIEGIFARNITVIVSIVALAQLVIAVLIALQGRAVRVGLFGAICFLLAIAPLGTGSGFPSTILMAVAALLLLRHRFDLALPAVIARWLRSHRQLRARTG